MNPEDRQATAASCLVIAAGIIAAWAVIILTALGVLH